MPFDGPNPGEFDLEKERINVLDWELLGKILIEMIVEPERSPEAGGIPQNSGDIKVLEDHFNNRFGQTIIDFPDRIKTFRIERSSWTEFVLRLPPWQLGAAGHARVCTPIGEPRSDVEYTPPPFYAHKINRDDPSINNCQFFFSRVADYTMSMCK